LHGFSGSLGENGGFKKENRGRGGTILTPNELVLTFGGLHVCVQFSENRRRNATVRVSTDKQTHTCTYAKRFYYLSHATCYSYGADNDKNMRFCGSEGQYASSCQMLCRSVKPLSRYRNFKLLGCRPPPSWISLYLKFVMGQTVTRAELRHRAYSRPKIGVFRRKIGEGVGRY